eukprot:5238814-Pleurochrysis_carterae.AAC.1
MSCGDNPDANMASDEGTRTPDGRHRNLASLNLRKLTGELSLLAQAAAIGEDYDAPDRMNVLADALCTIGGGRERCGTQFVAIRKRRKGRRN